MEEQRHSVQDIFNIILGGNMLHVYLLYAHGFDIGSLYASTNSSSTYEITYCTLYAAFPLGLVVV